MISFILFEGFLLLQTAAAFHSWILNLDISMVEKHVVVSNLVEFQAHIVVNFALFDPKSSSAVSICIYMYMARNH
jgi:hypothetical protein